MSLSLSSMDSPEKEGELNVGIYFQEGLSTLLPSQVVHEAFDSKGYTGFGEKQQLHHHHHNQHYADQLNPKFCCSRSLISPNYTSRSRGVKNWVSGGHGMQAIFLDSSPNSRGGTGVFLPQRAGTNCHPKKKPAYAPVLLPDRVIQALNLNVQALGLHISPKDRHRKRSRSGREEDIQDCLSPQNKFNGNKVDEQCYIISSENPTDSCPELCLPTEWTY